MPREGEIQPRQARTTLRKSYHRKLPEVLRGEISKDLVGHPLHDIEKAIAAP